MCRVVECVMALLLIVLAYKDWRTKRVSVWLLGVIMIVAVVARVFLVSMSIWETVGGVVMGVLLIGISKWSKEAIGYGDSWLICSLGIYLGGTKLLQTISFASFLACIFSIVYCVRHGWNRKHTLPYIPFVVAAYLGGMFL